jgi:hypothetical protein
MTHDKLTAAKHTPDCSSTITAFKIFCEAMASELEETVRQRDLLIEKLQLLHDITERAFAPSHAALSMGSAGWREGLQLRKAVDEAKEALVACGVK